VWYSKYVDDPANTGETGERKSAIWDESYIRQASRIFRQRSVKRKKRKKQGGTAMKSPLRVYYQDNMNIESYY
jgi:hypothetical protein